MAVTLPLADADATRCRGCGAWVWPDEWCPTCGTRSPNRCRRITLEAATHDDLYPICSVHGTDWPCPNQKETA